MKKKYWLMGITAALVAAVAVSGSLAAVSASGRQATNQLAAPTLDVGVTNQAVELKDSAIVPGGTLDESATTFQVRNTADVDEYTRVTIRKYWVAADTDTENGDAETQAEETGLDANLLSLSVDGSDWLTAEGGMSFTSGETDVFYYNRPISAGETVSLPLTISVSNEADNSYQNAKIQLEVTVDSVQFVKGENELNQQGIENTFGVLADLNGDGSIRSLAE